MSRRTHTASGGQDQREVRLGASIPYAWPYDGRLTPESLALVVCGAQRGLVRVSADAAPVADRLATLASGVRQAGGLVVWVRHGGRGAPRRGNASLPVRGSDAWRFAVEPTSPDEVVDAPGWDGCFGSDLDELLRTRAASRGGSCSVLAGGFASEITVDSTIRTLNDRGHECLVLLDGCAPLDVALGARAHASVTMSGGIFGAVGTCADVRALVARIGPPGRAVLRPDPHHTHQEVPA